MKNSHTSKAKPALTLAFLRAIEAYQPERERLFDDRFSQALMPGLWRVCLLPGLRDAEAALLELFAPGLRGELYCRTRYIDDVLCRALRAGLDQVVILGAGLDARPYRICGIERTHVFELDLPALLRLKQTLVIRVMGKLPAHVTFVPINFDCQNLAEVMPAAGFRSGLKTFFIWEAVTQYLTAEAVDRIFRYVAGAAAAGSEIVFTYIKQGIIDGTDRSRTDQILMFSADQARLSPWIFGLVPAGLARYLSQRGLKFIEDVGEPEFQTRYLRPRQREMSIFEGERVVLARIRGTAEGDNCH